MLQRKDVLVNHGNLMLWDSDLKVVAWVRVFFVCHIQYLATWPCVDTLALLVWEIWNDEEY